LEVFMLKLFLPADLPRATPFPAFRPRRRLPGAALGAFLAAALFLPAGCDQAYNPFATGPAAPDETGEAPGETTPEGEEAETGEGPGQGDEADEEADDDDDDDDDDEADPEDGAEGDEDGGSEASGEPDAGDEAGSEAGDEPGGGGAGDKGGSDAGGEPGGGGTGDKGGAEAGDEPGQPDAGEPVLVSIEVQTPPVKLVYAKGEDLDPAGIAVAGLYSDGSTRQEDPEALEFSGYDKTVSGDQAVRVSLEGKTADFTVRVSLSRLSLNITRYEEGEMAVSGLPQGEILLSRSGAEGLPQELSLWAEGYEQVWCFVNGTEISPAETGFVLRAADYSVHHHVITLIGVNAGVPYGREFPFSVLE
jgi:hypothetical protein